MLRDGSVGPYPLEDGLYIPLRHDLFDEDAIVLSGMAPGLRLESTKGRRSIHVIYPQMDYLGIWHMPHGDAPYICIEPWSSLPGREGRLEELEKQPDLIALEGGGRYENSWCIALEEK